MEQQADVSEPKGPILKMSRAWFHSPQHRPDSECTVWLQQVGQSSWMQVILAPAGGWCPLQPLLCFNSALDHKPLPANSPGPELIVTQVLYTVILLSAGLQACVTTPSIDLDSWHCNGKWSENRLATWLFNKNSNRNKNCWISADQCVDR